MFYCQNFLTLGLRGTKTSTRLFFENFSSVRQYRLRKLVGMDKCLRLFCIGGIISDHVFDSLVELGLLIQEVFGCSETCGPHLWAEFNAEEGWLFNCHKNQKASILKTGELVLSGKNIFLDILVTKKRQIKSLIRMGHTTRDALLKV